MSRELIHAVATIIPIVSGTLLVTFLVVFLVVLFKNVKKIGPAIRLRLFGEKPPTKIIHYRAPYRRAPRPRQ